MLSVYRAGALWSTDGVHAAVEVQLLHQEQPGATAAVSSGYGCAGAQVEDQQAPSPAASCLDSASPSCSGCMPCKAWLKEDKAAQPSLYTLMSCCVQPATSAGRLWHIMAAQGIRVPDSCLHSGATWAKATTTPLAAQACITSQSSCTQGQPSAGSTCLQVSRVHDPRHPPGCLCRCPPAA